LIFQRLKGPPFEKTLPPCLIFVLTQSFPREMDFFVFFFSFVPWKTFFSPPLKPFLCFVVCFPVELRFVSSSWHRRPIFSLWKKGDCPPPIGPEFSLSSLGPVQFLGPKTGQQHDTAPPSQPWSFGTGASRSLAFCGKKKSAISDPWSPPSYSPLLAFLFLLPDSSRGGGTFHSPRGFPPLLLRGDVSLSFFSPNKKCTGGGMFPHQTFPNFVYPEFPFFPSGMESLA